MGKTHGAIFVNLIQQNRERDVALESILESYRQHQVHRGQLGVRMELDPINVSPAIATLSRLNDRQSPMDKNDCIKRAIDAISASVQQYVTEQEYSWLQGGTVITP